METSTWLRGEGPAAHRPVLLGDLVLQAPEPGALAGRDVEGHERPPDQQGHVPLPVRADAQELGGDRDHARWRG